MKNFIARKQSILSVFEEAKTNLETLNTEIVAKIGDNDAESRRLAESNNDLRDLLAENHASISMFSKLFGKVTGK